MIHNLRKENFFFLLEIGQGLTEVLADVLPLGICQFMNRSIDGISQVGKEQKMLGGLSRLYENQFIVVSLTDFFHCRCIERTRRGSFDITSTGHADESLLFDNQTSCINLDRLSGVLQLTATRIAKELLNFTQLLFHEIEHGPFIPYDGCQGRDLLLEVGMLFFQGYDIRIGQTVQLQSNNGFCLFFREIVADLEVFLSIRLVIRSTDQSDDFIEDRNDTDQAFYDVEASFRLFLVKARTSDNDIPTVCNVAR